MKWISGTPPRKCFGAERSYGLAVHGGLVENRGAEKWRFRAESPLALIAQQVHLAEVEAEHQASLSAAQLVACFLQRLCVLYDFDPQGFELPYSKTLIASRLGMELETFSRTVSKLKEHGITVEGTRVIIHNLCRIEAYVCGTCSIASECPTHRAMENKIHDGAQTFIQP